MSTTREIRYRQWDAITRDTISHAYGTEVTAAMFVALRAYVDSLAAVAAVARGTESSRTAAWLRLSLGQVRGALAVLLGIDASGTKVAIVGRLCTLTMDSPTDTQTTMVLPRQRRTPRRGGGGGGGGGGGSGGGSAAAAAGGGDDGGEDPEDDDSPDFPFPLAAAATAAAANLRSADAEAAFAVSAADQEAARRKHADDWRVAAAEDERRREHERKTPPSPPLIAADTLPPPLMMDARTVEAAFPVFLAMLQRIPGYTPTTPPATVSAPPPVALPFRQVPTPRCSLHPPHAAHSRSRPQARAILPPSSTTTAFHGTLYMSRARVSAPPAYSPAIPALRMAAPPLLATCVSHGFVRCSLALARSRSRTRTVGIPLLS